MRGVHASIATMGSSHSTNQSINCGLVDGDTTSEFCRSGSADDETTLPNFASSEGTSEGSETNDPPQKLPCVDQTHSRHSAILIFDLDDTLIPTEWIRSSFAVQKHKHATTDEVYQVSGAMLWKQACTYSSGRSSSKTKQTDANMRLFAGNTGRIGASHIK